MPPKRNDIVKIIIGCNELGIDRHDFLAMNFNKNSSNDLSQYEAFKALAILKERGFTPTYKKKKIDDRSKNKTVKKRKITANSDQDKKIRAMWITMHHAGLVRNPSEKAMAQYVQRMARVARLEWCSSEKKVLVIEAMKKWQTRDLFENWLFRQWLLDGTIVVDVETKGLIWRANAAF